MNVRIGLAQINTIVGDLEGNSRKILEYLERARSEDVDIIAFPELTLTGYPPEDLLLRNDFLEATKRVLQELIPHVRNLVAIVGFAECDGNHRYNAAAVICDGQLVGIYRKQCLPNYGVFDELRYFRPGELLGVFSDGHLSFGVTICEDLWCSDNPISAQARAGAQLIINISASPYEIYKPARRESLVAKHSAQARVALALCNLVGGQDELVFDGQSLVYDQAGRLIARAKAFEEDLLIADLSLVSSSRTASSNAIMALPRAVGRYPVQRRAPRVEPLLPEAQEIYRALVLATRDYVRKNGFHKVIVGLSGGIDSALVACIAVDALGPENVLGVFLPSRFTSQLSRTSAIQVARNLGIELVEIDIDPLYESTLRALAPVFGQTQFDVTEENVQSRVRAVVWMALANKFRALVLTAGNKSELAVGYATLYGDMAGGFCVLKDITKTRVYQLARWRNTQAEVIPLSILERAPTAELRPHQTDEADLPAPYRDLDRVLEAYVERNQSPREIAQTLQLAESVVREIISLIHKSEYKRRQAPVGPKITPRAFGRDWRQPIVNSFAPP
ncbi:MAG: NAD+ synthase [Candidatus Bipolaricaulota bacterium]|nr:NAD+ synthase [Candidatus Bipolaricaulota bacterium]MDW8030584.1 NAD+ synthase [Candidatus Bipolaricaulota bacterium]